MDTKRIKQVILLILIPVAPASLSALFHTRDRAEVVPLIEQIKPSDHILFLDARSEEARRQKSLPWTLRLTEETWEQDLPEVLAAWTPESRFLIFCDGGQCNRSHQVSERLKRETGLKRISVIDGGERDAIKMYQRVQGAAK